MNWYKWIGIILLSLATASVGFWLAYRLDKRLEEYRQCKKYCTYWEAVCAWERIWLRLWKAVLRPAPVRFSPG